MPQMKRRLWIALALLVLCQSATYLALAPAAIPALALDVTPERMHFVSGATFSWVYLDVDRCENLTPTQRASLEQALASRYAVYTSATAIPDSMIEQEPGGPAVAYRDGFRFAFSIVSRRPFWVTVRHQDFEAGEAGSRGTHAYIWILFTWVKVSDGPMMVS